MNTISVSNLIQTKYKIKTFGFSMLPLLKDGDIVFYSKTSLSRLKVNDIIVVKSNNFFITHRVVHKAYWYVITKGDNNLQSDGRIYPQQIVGKVYKIKRRNQEYPLETLYMLQSGIYLKELISLNKQLDKKQVKYIFLKGLPLHLFYENKIPRRIYADCDILIEESQLEMVKTIVQKLGFSSIQRYSKNSNRKYVVEEEFYKIVNNIPVILDIHIEPFSVIGKVGFTDGLYPNNLKKQLIQNFFTSRRIIQVNGEKFPILSWKNLILFLSIHFITHGCTGYHRLQIINSIFKKEIVTEKKYTEFIVYAKKWFFDSFIFLTFSFLVSYHKTFYKKKLSLLNVNNVVKRRAIYLLKKGLFCEEKRNKRGFEKLITLLILSKEPWYRKSMFFLNPAFWYLFSVVLLRFSKRIQVK
jgi:signal peptidase I